MTNSATAAISTPNINSPLTAVLSRSDAEQHLKSIGVAVAWLKLNYLHCEEQRLKVSVLETIGLF